MTPNQKAFLDAIAWSEIGPGLLAMSDNGYNVEVGGTLFEGYADHPRKLIFIPRLNISSTAAGRYQVLAHYFDAYKKLLNLPDFSPESQDAIALQQIRERGAWLSIESGDFATAINLVSNIWASLPGAQYGQHTNKLDQLQTAYLAAGGTLA